MKHAPDPQIASLMRTATVLIVACVVATRVAQGQSPSPGTPDLQRFQVHSDTTTDVVTRLEWAGRDNGAGIGWRSAVRHCDELTVAGFTDWRLPTIFELEALSRAVSSYPIETTANGEWRRVPGVRLSGRWFWSSTPDSNPDAGSGTAWGLDLRSSGTRSAALVDDVYNSTERRALCVRPASR